MPDNGSLTAGDICHRTVLLARRDDTASMAARQMADAGVGTLVLMDDEERPEGIITDRDLVVRVLARGRDPDRTALFEVATPFPTVVSEDASPLAALALMRDTGARRLPVVDRAGDLCGMLSLDDVLSAVLRSLSYVPALLADQAPAE